MDTTTGGIYDFILRQYRSKAFGTEEVLKNTYRFMSREITKKLPSSASTEPVEPVLKIIVGELAADEGSVTIAKATYWHSTRYCRPPFINVPMPALAELQMKHASKNYDDASTLTAA